MNISMKIRGGKKLTLIKFNMDIYFSQIFPRVQIEVSSHPYLKIVHTLDNSPTHLKSSI